MQVLNLVLHLAKFSTSSAKFSTSSTDAVLNLVPGKRKLKVRYLARGLHGSYHTLFEICCNSRGLLLLLLQYLHHLAEDSGASVRREHGVDLLAAAPDVGDECWSV